MTPDTKLSPTLFSRSNRAITITLLALAILLRVFSAFANTDMMADYTALGGDTAWYLANGEGILSGQNSGISQFGIPYYVEVLPIPPLYLLYVGAWQKLLAPEPAIVAIKIGQIVLSLLTALCVAGVARAIAQDDRAGWLALLVMSVDPAQVIEPRLISTETLYLFWVAGALWLYTHTLRFRPSGTALALVGFILGLATLTRAASLLFPVMLAGHLVWVWRKEWRRALLWGAVFIGVYGATIGTWTLYNALQYNRLVVVSTQLMPAIWRGAVENDGSPEQNDSLLIQPSDVPNDCQDDCKFQVSTDTYVEQTTAVIQASPLNYVKNRLSELANAFLQPHTTIVLGGESLRDLTLHWVRDDFTWDGFVRLINGENFWVKGLIYLFQWVGMVAGLVALWVGRRRWHYTTIPFTFIAYTTLIHVVLLVIPRYIFPLTVTFWMLAPITLLAVYDRFRQRKPVV